MRPIRPLFNRHNAADELRRDAERLKNRDWVEILRVVHPSQAESAEREYLLARLNQDWAELASPLLATHSLPESLKGKMLIVACDHNTFANELKMIAPVVEKRITARYGITLKIIAQASRRMDWRKTEIVHSTETSLNKDGELARAVSPEIDELIRRLEKIEST